MSCHLQATHHTIRTMHHCTMNLFAAAASLISHVLTCRFILAQVMDDFCYDLIRARRASNEYRSKTDVLSRCMVRIDEEEEEEARKSAKGKQRGNTDDCNVDSNGDDAPPTAATARKPYTPSQMRYLRDVILNFMIAGG